MMIPRACLQSHLAPACRSFLAKLRADYIRPGVGPGRIICLDFTNEKTIAFGE